MFEARVPWRALALAALMALLLAAALSQYVQVGAGSSAPPRADGASGGLSSLPAPARASISAALGAEDRAYRILAQAGALQAANPAQHLSIAFGPKTVSLASTHMKLGLSLRAVGYGAALRALPPARPTASVNRVFYSHSGINAWYVNGPLGLEQGFTVARARVPGAAGPLTLAIAVTGGAHASLAQGGQSVILHGSDGGTLRYGGLSSSDAQGQPLHSWMTIAGGEILLRVDSANASFPVRIDPTVETLPEQRLTPEEVNNGGRFGVSVALSTEGNTAIVGAPRELGGVGAAWVFNRSEEGWGGTTSGMKLTMPEGSNESCGEESAEEAEGGNASNEANQCRFGQSVTLSSDGNTAFVGAPHANGDTGAVFVFTRSGSAWAATSELTPPDGGGGKSQFGRSVAVSAGGETVLVGAPALHGRAWVFTRSGSGWELAAGPLTGGGEEGEGAFGRSVALSANGETALIGAPGYGSSQGYAWVFNRSGKNWDEQGTRVLEGDAGAVTGFGGSVALSGEGSTALVGAREDDNDNGGAWAFTVSGEGWSEQGPMLTGGGEEGEEFGSSVALSFNGDSALIGASAAAADRGAAWVFGRSSEGSWGAPLKKLEGGSAETTHARFGASVALSSEASTLLVGGRSEQVQTEKEHEHKIGAAWVFGRGPSIAFVTLPGPPEEPVKTPVGPTAGGTTIKIVGEHLAGATKVHFGSNEAASYEVVSEKVMMAVSPPGEGDVDVTVTTPYGVSAKTGFDHFIYKNPGESGEGKHGGKGGENHGGEGNTGGTSSENSANTGTGNGSATVQANGVVLSFGPVAGQACGVSLRSKKIAVQSSAHASSRRALLKLLGTGTGKCSGKLTLKVKRRLASKRLKTVTIGTASFSILSGKTVTVSVKLNATGRALLQAGHGLLNASLLIVKASPAPAQAHSASVRLTQQKTKPAKKT